MVDTDSIQCIEVTFMAKDNSPTASERVYKYVYKQINMRGEGEKLPSIRGIIKECGTSQHTVQAVLKKFHDCKLIEASDRRGYFVSRKSRSTISSIGHLDLIYCGSSSDEDPLMKFHGELSQRIGKLCGEKWTGMRIHFVEDDADDTEYERIVSNKNCHACILVSSPHAGIGEICSANQVMYVELFPRAYQLNKTVPNIVIDPYEVVSMQLRHLIGLGHTKIGYLHCVDSSFNRDLSFRRECFYRLVAEKGLQIKRNWVQYGGYRHEEIEEASKAMLGKEDAPTAMIVSDHHLPVVYNTARQYGLEIGEDLSVVGTDNMSIAAMLSPQATTVNLPRDVAVQMAIRSLEQALGGEEFPPLQCLPLNLIERDSTGAVR